ncbi:cupin domain-containing protein [Pseudomonas sp. UL073]|uniref:Cupin domain-containing protein n=1 Tax=Zestomonas insulae TaxID=2809017 RepID=A0ABS2IAR5_9GAMM|nr:cupin domain-containing protein [Pseudomonas insulae]MBM7060100.1 cupin domain-containing protein [Pseudomonas insulae]
MDARAAELIRSLELTAHPEGGYYRRTFQAAQTVGGRRTSSAILYLLPGGVHGRWHAVDADELWHFYEGAPLELLIAETPDAVLHERLGPVCADQLPQRAVPAHAWQAARSLGAFTLVGCTVAPEFQFSSFRLLGDDAAAQRQWPQLVDQYGAFL